MNLTPPDNTPVAQREGVKKTVGFTVDHMPHSLGGKCSFTTTLYLQHRVQDAMVGCWSAMYLNNIISKKKKKQLYFSSELQFLV